MHKFHQRYQQIYNANYAWYWLSGDGGWLKTLRSWVRPLLAAELTPGGVDSACHPSEVGKMSTSVLVEGHNNSGTAVLPRNDSDLAAKLPSARTEQNCQLGERQKSREVQKHNWTDWHKQRRLIRIARERSAQPQWRTNHYKCQWPVTPHEWI